jgi:hypothetical protein
VTHQRPRAVGELLVSAVPELRDRLVEDRVRRSWSGLVGPDVARRAQPHALTNGCLHVVVDNSPWLQELTLRASELTARLGERFEAVRSLRFTLGQLDVRLGPSPVPAAPSSRALTPDDVREIDETVASISNPEVRAAARRLLGVARRFTTPQGAVS